MADPLTLLCDHASNISSSKSISLALLDDEGNTVRLSDRTPALPAYISFSSSLCFPFNSPTPINCRKSSTISGNENSSVEYYTVGALYILWTRRTLPYTEYLQECRQNGWPHVSIVDRKNVLAILSRESSVIINSMDISSASSSLYIQPLTTEQIKRRKDPGRPATIHISSTLLYSTLYKGQKCAPYFVWATISGPHKKLQEYRVWSRKKRLFLESIQNEDENYYELPSDSPTTKKSLLDDAEEAGAALSSAGDVYSPNEKPHFLANAPFVSKGKSYSQVVSMLKSLFKPTLERNTQNPSKTKESGKPAKETSGDSKLKTSLLPSSSLGSVNLSNPRNLLEHIYNKPDNGATKQPSEESDLKNIPKESSTTKNLPIIIVPFSSTALINMFNVKSFLEEERYVPSHEARAKMNGRKPSAITINRLTKVPLNGGQSHTTGQLSYLVVDSTIKLKPEDWGRVVAVFVQGVLWQFKGWKYETPMDVFTNVKGFFLKFDDEGLDQTVKKWNVSVLSIHRAKRHLDVEAVLHFWNKLDQWMSGRGLIHTPTGGLSTSVKM